MDVAPFDLHYLPISQRTIYRSVNALFTAQSMHYLPLSQCTIYRSVNALFSAQSMHYLRLSQCTIYGSVNALFTAQSTHYLRLSQCTIYGSVNALFTVVSAYYFVTNLAPCRRTVLLLILHSIGGFQPFCQPIIECYVSPPCGRFVSPLLNVMSAHHVAALSAHY